MIKLEDNANIGALWEKVSKAGDTYFSGLVDLGNGKTQIVVFKNKYKKEERHPDYKIYISKEK